MRPTGLPPRAAWWFLFVLISLLLLPAAVFAQAQAQAQAQVVHGLVVRLKDAPSHLQLSGRGRGDESQRPLHAATRDRERLRWQGVQIAAGQPDATAWRLPALRPVGRDQQLLVFKRPMPLAEAQALRTRLAQRTDVEWVELNTRERRLQVPSDPFFPYAGGGGQWWLAPAGGTDGNVLVDRRRGVPGFQSAWVLPGGTGLPSAVVAVLDTGITPHPDLATRVLPGYDFVTDIKFAGDGGGRDADPTDPGDGVSAADLTDPHFTGCVQTTSSWHGTVIAGMVAAVTNNAEGAAGINWNGRVLPVRVAGKCGADVADIVDGMRWAAGLPVCRIADSTGTCLEFVPTNPHRARIVNISFGSNRACGGLYQAAVDELKAAGVVVVAAAGNEHTTPTRPANCPGVVGVAGLARDGFKTHYSNFGGDLAATGIATVSGDDNADPMARWNVLADEGLLTIGNAGNTSASAPDFAHGYFYFWGTSFSAPIVSGAVSLMLSVNPSLTYAQIIDGLRRSARPHVVSSKIGTCSNANPGRCICSAATCGAGILDAEQALRFAADPALYVPPVRLPAQIEAAQVAAVVAQFPTDRDANAGGGTTPPAAGGSGGGGLSVVWLLALAAAAGALAGGARSARVSARAVGRGRRGRR